MPSVVLLASSPGRSDNVVCLKLNLWNGSKFIISLWSVIGEYILFVYLEDNFLQKSVSFHWYKTVDCTNVRGFFTKWYSKNKGLNGLRLYKPLQPLSIVFLNVL